MNRSGGNWNALFLLRLAMTEQRRVRVVGVADIDRPVGGIQQLYSLVSELRRLGTDAAVVTVQKNFLPTWFEQPAGDSLTAHGEQLSPDDTLLFVPETCVSSSLEPWGVSDLQQYPYVVVNQNAYYSLGEFVEASPEAVARFYRSPGCLHVLCVSEDSRVFLRQALGLPAERISRVVYSLAPLPPLPAQCRTSARRPQILWMPRKNSLHGQAVARLLQLNAPPARHQWQLSPLDGLSRDQVLRALGESRIFLSFGHPEGFGLPVAEAMAMGCWVIGYSGLGGDELFGLGGSTPVRYGDWAGFHRAVADVITTFEQEPAATDQILRRQALACRQRYSDVEYRDSVAAAWSLCRDRCGCWPR